jgi:hypothetical protein
MLTTTTIFTETRNYYLQPNESQSDFISYIFPQKATYTIQISNPKILAPINTLINILNPDEINASLTIGTPETNNIPITVDIANTGFNSFNGTLIIEASGTRFENPIAVNPISSLKQTFPLQTTSLNPGTNDISIIIQCLRTLPQTSNRYSG